MAEQAKRTEIAYVVETKDDDELADRMWESNLRHGVQYTRDQRQTHGLKLHERSLSAKEIADRVGVGVNTVYRWTKAQREKAKQEREQAVLDVAGEGKTQKEIADELRIDQATVSRIMQNPQMGEMHKDSDEPAPEAPEPDITVVREGLDKPEPELELPPAESETIEWF